MLIETANLRAQVCEADKISHTALHLGVSEIGDGFPQNTGHKQLGHDYCCCESPQLKKSVEKINPLKNR